MHKRLSIIIALKRRNRNSVFKKQSNHLIAKELGISTYLFSKLFKEAVSCGWIVDSGDYYRIIRFEDILEEYCEEMNYSYGNFSVLKKRSLNYKEILNELYQQIIKTNIYDKQNYILSLKRDLFSKNNRTVKRASNRLKKLSGYEELSVDKIQKALNTRVKTSARAVSCLLGVSVMAANRILNSNTMFKREITHLWVKGVGMLAYEKTKMEFPDATVIPTMKGYFKVCFGSSISLRLSSDAISMYQN